MTLNDMPAWCAEYDFPEIEEKWNKLFELRGDVMKALELARAEKLIGKSLDAKVTIYTEDEETYALLEGFKNELSTVFIVSASELVKGAAPAEAFTETSAPLAVVVEGAPGHKCDRCWMYSCDGEMTEDGFICSRCKAIVE